MISATQREYNYFKRNGHCFDLGSLAYNELTTEGKIPKKAKDPSKGLEYAKKLLVEGYEADKSLANEQMTKYWQDRIDNIDELVNSATKLKGSSVLRDDVFVYFKRYIVNEYFKTL